MVNNKCDWNKLVDDFLVSGLTQAEFGRQNQINAKYLSLHLGKRKNKDSDHTVDKPAFIKVTTPEPKFQQSLCSVELNIQQTSLKINNPDPLWLASFCQELAK